MNRITNEVVPVEDYIRSLSYGVQWDEEIEDYVRETGFLPDYYNNTCSAFQSDNVENIYLVDLWDVGDLKSNTLTKTIFRGYRNLWKWIAGEDFDEKELLEISAIGLGIQRYVNTMFEEIPLDGLLSKGKKFFELWIKEPSLLSDNKTNLYVEDFHSIREHYHRHFDYIGFMFMEALGLNTMLVQSFF